MVAKDSVRQRSHLLAFRLTRRGQKEFIVVEQRSTHGDDGAKSTQIGVELIDVHGLKSWPGTPEKEMAL